MFIRKRELDEKVAALTGATISDVSVTTSLFLRLAVLELSRGHSVNLSGLGLCSVSSKKGTVEEGVSKSKFTLRVKKAKAFISALQRYWPIGEEIMDKYGVDEGVDQASFEKAAAEGCPKCGVKTVQHGRIILCPKCGTEPFENKNSK